MTHDAATLADTIARELTERIVAGTLAPGERLRQELIAGEFGASHVPVREAFQQLLAAGLATREPRRGMRVAPMDPASIREVTDMRAALETLALRRGLARFDAATLQDLERILAMAERAATLRDWDVANRAFHRALARRCAMPRLLVSIDELQLSSSRFVLAGQPLPGWQARSNQDHRQIVDAVRARDLECAVDLLNRHILGMEQFGAAGDG